MKDIDQICLTFTTKHRGLPITLLKLVSKLSLKHGTSVNEKYAS